MSGHTLLSVRNRRASFKERVEPLMSQMGKRVLQNKFFDAIYTRNIPEITKFLNKGVNPNCRSSEYGVSPIHLLAERNDYIVGFRLTECKNINLEVRTIFGYTALHLSCIFNCKKFAILLLEKGADPNRKERFQKTALHLAVERENYGVVVKLLKSGAGVNVMDCFENTPLSLSIVQKCNLLIAKTLFQHGANMSLECKRSLHIFFETILNCRTIKQIDFVMLLLDNGVNINMREAKSGRNCLHFVAITGYLELAVILVQKGARWNAVDSISRTPSRAASDHGNEIIADYFRKGYRPPHLLTTLPLLFLWSKKLKARLAERKAAELAEGSNK